VIVPYTHVLVLAGILFVTGMFTTVARRNLIMVVLGLEIMLNASAVAFVGASLRWQLLDGQALVLFIIAVAATEVSVGLALVVAAYRRTGSVDPGQLDETEARA
jgi:NADH-quinone oxidoreductase subunit K